MRKIVMILESGEEIFCGFATSVFKYLQGVYQCNIVPLHGNREYAMVRNIYNEERRQLVSYKSIPHD